MTILFGAPAVASNGDGRLEVFAFTVDGALWHIWQTAWSNSNSWSEWSPMDIGGSWPAVVAANGDGRLELFVAGNELLNAAQTAWSNSNSWSESPPPRVAARPGAGLLWSWCRAKRRWPIGTIRRQWGALAP